MSVRGFAVEGIERLADGDAVIDFEVTGNRPDCMSVVGMAREVATAYGLQVRRPAVSTSLRRAGGQVRAAPLCIWRRSRLSNKATSTSSSRIRTCARATPARSPT